MKIWLIERAETRPQRKPTGKPLGPETLLSRFSQNFVKTLIPLWLFVIEALWVFLITPQLFCKGWFSLHLLPTMATSWCSSGFSYKVALILGAWLEAEVFVAPSIVWFLPLITPFPKPVELFSWLWSPLRGCHQRMVFSARLFLFCGLARALSHPYPPPFIAPAKLTKNVLKIITKLRYNFKYLSGHTTMQRCLCHWNSKKTSERF